MESRGFRANPSGMPQSHTHPTHSDVGVCQNLQPEVVNQVNTSNTQTDALERRSSISVSLGKMIVVSAE